MVHQFGKFGKGSVMLRNRLKGLMVAGAALVLLPVLFAQEADPPKMAGQPNISGVWLADHFQPALFPKGTTPPLTARGAEEYKKNDANVNDPNLGCLPHGVPRIMFVPIPFQIFQVPTEVLLFEEAGNELRQIHLNRGHLKDMDPTYFGDSVGKWEGDTLVVDTIGFNEITWLDHVGLPHSDALHVVERIHRTGPTTLQDDVTIEDPKIFTKPFSVSQKYNLKPGWEIQEYVCDHNKYEIHNNDSK